MKTTSGITEFNPPQIPASLFWASDSGAHARSAGILLTSMHWPVVSCLDGSPPPPVWYYCVLLVWCLPLGLKGHIFLALHSWSEHSPRCSLSHHVLHRTGMYPELSRYNGTTEGTLNYHFYCFYAFSWLPEEPTMWSEGWNFQSCRPDRPDLTWLFLI